MKHFSDREFRTAMGQFCTGVVVVTGVNDGHPAGFSVQSFMSLSLQPPLVAICPARTSTSWPRVRKSGSFGINILGADQKALCATFARSGGEKFGSLIWTRGVTGSPMLEGVLGFIDCHLEAEHHAGDHTIAVGRVVDLKVLDAIRVPLLFFRGVYGAFDRFPVEPVTGQGQGQGV